MVKRSVLNTFVRQRIALSLLLKGGKNCYQMAKEWGEVDRQNSFRKNCRFLKNFNEEVKKKIVKNSTQTYGQIAYDLNYKIFSEQIILQLLQRCKEKKMEYDPDAKFNEKDFTNVAEFCRTELFKFFVKEAFFDHKNKNWMINKRDRFLITEPFIQFVNPLYNFRTRKDYERKRDEWKKHLNMSYSLTFSEEEFKSFKFITTGGAVYKFIKTIEKIRPRPNKDRIRIHFAADDPKYISEEGIELPPYYRWWR